MTGYDCGNCGHSWAAEEQQECCPSCHALHIMTSDDWIEEDARNEANDFAEELTPEGVQLVISGAERITEPTTPKPQGSLW